MSEGKKIRVLIVTHTLADGGLEEVVRTYTELLDRSRFDVTVAFMVGGRISQELARSGFAVVQIATTNRIRRLIQLVRLARSQKIDIVHNHLSWYGMIAGIMAGAYRIETIHNTYSWFVGLRRWAFALNCLVAHKVIAVSNIVRIFSLLHFPLLNPDKVIVIHNGVRYSVVPARREVTRLALKIDDTSFVIVFVGRLENEKGVGFLLEAAAQLGKIYSDVVVLIAGSGSLREQLEAQARQVQNVDIRFLGFRNDVLDILAASDLFVLPSLYEGLPLTLLQAMGVGCPPIATRVGGVPEVVEDGVSGFLVPSQSALDLAARMAELHDDAQRRRSIAEHAAAHVKDAFTAEIMVRKTEALYGELLKKAARHSAQG